MRSVAVWAAHAAVSVAWLVVWHLDAAWHEVAVVVVVAAWHLVAAFLGRRVWFVLLPLLPLVLSLAAGAAHGDYGGDRMSVFDFVLLATPATAAATLVGLGAARVVRGAGASGGGTSPP